MSDEEANNNSRRNAIKRFTGKSSDFSAWIHSVKLHAMSTGSRDILDDFDNPYKRGRRMRDETLERDPEGDGDLFTEEGEEIVRTRETETDFVKAKLDWSKRRNRLFADIGRSLKGTSEGLTRQVKSGDVQGLMKLVSDAYGDTTGASRYALIMELILLRLDKPGNLDKHILKFTDLKRRLAGLTPAEKLTDGAETCLFMHSLTSCAEFKGLVETALLRDQNSDSTMTLQDAVTLSREFSANKNVAATEQGLSTYRVQSGKESTESRFNGKCNYCGKKGHKARDCRKRKREKKEGGNARDEAVKRDSTQKKPKFKVNSVAVAGARVAAAKTKHSDGKAGYHELVLDSGAARHCIKEGDLLTDTKPCKVDLIVASGDERTATSYGTLTATFNPGSDSDEMEGAFKNALHTPGFDRSLLSAMAIYRNGGAVHLEKGNCYFKPTRANLKVDVKVHGDDFIVPVMATATRERRFAPPVCPLSFASDFIQHAAS